jgi:tRNA pseudouridine38-40 synthase
MVRNIVGALVYVGAEKIPAAQISTLLAEKNRAHAPPTFAPDGLYLAGIQYPACFEIPEAFVDVVM